MSEALQIVLLVITILVIAFGIVYLALRWAMRLGKRKQADMEVRFPKSKAIIPNVNYFGQKSKGAGQLRGNGTMLLTDDALVFEMWLLNRDLTIPFSAITGIENPRSFLGKSRFRPLLQVNFTNADGQPDSAAWHVPDVEGLQRLIETAVKERS